MEETSIELRQLLEEDRLANTPLLIMANKQDLMNALSPAEVCLFPPLLSIADNMRPPLAAHHRFGTPRHQRQGVAHCVLLGQDRRWSPGGYGVGCRTDQQ